MTGEQQMAQALADTAPPLNADTIDRLRRILAAPAQAAIPFPARAITARPTAQNTRQRRAA